MIGPVKSDKLRSIHQAAPKFDELSLSVELLDRGSDRKGEDAAIIAKAAPSIHVDVVSAEESIFSGEAEFVVLPGELGI